MAFLSFLFHMVLHFENVQKVCLLLSIKHSQLYVVLNKSKVSTKVVAERSKKISHGNVFILPLAGSSLFSGLQIFSPLTEANASQVSERESAGCFLADMELFPVVLCGLHHLRTRWSLQRECLQVCGFLSLTLAVLSL